MRSTKRKAVVGAYSERCEILKSPVDSSTGEGWAGHLTSRHSQFMFQSPCLRSEGNMEVFKLETGCSGCVPPVPVANTGGGCVGRNVWRSRPTWSSRDILWWYYKHISSPLCICSDLGRRFSVILYTMPGESSTSSVVFKSGTTTTQPHSHVGVMICWSLK